MQWDVSKIHNKYWGIIRENEVQFMYELQGEKVKELQKKKSIIVIILVAALIHFTTFFFDGKVYAAENSNQMSHAAEHSDLVTYTAELPDRMTGIHTAYIYGYPDGTVRPLGVLTREEAAVIFCRLMEGCDHELSEKTEQKFCDVDSDRWSYSEITRLAEAGLLKGYLDGSFRPEKPITRAEFAAIASHLETQFEIKAPSFPDTVNHWAEERITYSVSKGWLRSFGDGTFQPEKHILRCESMMLINDALDRRVTGEGIYEEVLCWPDNPKDKWYYEIVQEACNSHQYERVNKPKSTEKWISERSAP